ncbi:2-oxoglutarate ferredoxin oxidoreductase subunit alpha [bacterium CG17_big_fil_post_rev_8_21_14_2_50_64_8]|nr:MAG: 2-oxoglutarate ferredoxin oxidoreductase subunit alpha [bacterium CG17_big_fil_post_rev_8_21_14_2_50_64_8]PJA76434.1 MAG: 2-oxoglutarate ferredoxin oxidoreductase subunit alpha [bacterium CG_4_9_14_3_um_filter_65_15]
MSSEELTRQDDVTIRFAGDSGDGMQLTGMQFTATTATVGNDLATFPDFPAEIRAPAGTRAGVSGYQIHFSSRDIYTPGDDPSVLVAMNPAALITNYKDLKPGGILLVNTGAFTESDLKKAGLDSNPLTDGTLSGYRVVKEDINQRTMEALADTELSKKDKLRCKNFYTLGMVYWLYSRPLEPTMEWLKEKFAKKPELAEANTKALKAGYNHGELLRLFQGHYEVPKVENAPKGTYRNIMGNEALAIGLVAGARLAGLKAFLGSYPITPATDILQHMSLLKNYDVITCQMEDEIAGICTAIGASFAGRLGMTTTSGPGLALKTEAAGLAVITELPLVIVDVQRGGPSTGLPTKVEQSDLLQAMFGRNGEAPIPVIACATPSDAFDCAVEACRIATQYMTPVLLLSDNYIANGAEPWKLPVIDELKPFPVEFATDPEGFSPYSRDEKLARNWAKPGTPGLMHRIGGLEKDAVTGNVSYDPENHMKMTEIREAKIMGIRDSIPTPQPHGAESGDLLVVAWGSTMGATRAAVERLHKEGVTVAHLHLRHIWPLPQGLDEIFSRYKKIVVPEMNMGQLARLLQSEYPDYRFKKFSKVMGKPFRARELKAHFAEILEEK